MDRALQSLLDWYAQVGVETPEVAATPQRMRARTPHRRIDPSAAPRKASPRQPAAPRTPADPTRIDAAPIAAACKTLDALKAAIETYDAGALSDAARQAVFARGNPAAKLMVIGEAPSREDDSQGAPLLGATGQLLDRMLAAIGLGAEDSYVTNVCYWAPPHGRKPEADELAMCRPFVRRHIELAAPKVILLMGGIAMQSLCGASGIMRQHGQWQTIAFGDTDMPALPIYHPAFLLKQPALKADAWQDLLTLREHLLTV